MKATAKDVAAPPPRQAVQIVATAQAGLGISLFALCNDGTIWETRLYTPNAVWRSMPEIPQPKIDEPESDEAA